MLITSQWQHLALSSLRGGWSLWVPGSAELQSRAPGADEQSLTPLQHCCDLPCCGHLLCNTPEGCWQILTQLKPRRTGQLKQAAKHPPVLQGDWDQCVPTQSHSSSLQTVKQGLLEGSQQPLQMAWTGREGNVCPWPYPVSWRTLCPLTISWTAAVCNFRCLQFRWRRWRETLLISSEPARFPFPYSFMYND